MARGMGNVRLPDERRCERRRGVGVPLTFHFARLARALVSLYVLTGTCIVVCSLRR